VAQASSARAVGIEPEPATEDQSNAGSAKVGSAAEDSDKAPRTRRPRKGTKQQMLVAMLRRHEGATVPEVVAATGGLPHTVRGAIAGALKKKLRLQISSEKVEGRKRVYRIG